MDLMALGRVCVMVVMRQVASRRSARSGRGRIMSSVRVACVCGVCVCISQAQHVSLIMPSMSLVSLNRLRSRLHQRRGHRLALLVRHLFNHTDRVQAEGEQGRGGLHVRDLCVIHPVPVCGGVRVGGRYLLPERQHLHLRRASD